MAFHGFVGGKTVGGCTFDSPVPIWPGQRAYVAKAQNFQHPHDMHDCVSAVLDEDLDVQPSSTGGGSSSSNYL